MLRYRPAGAPGARWAISAPDGILSHVVTRGCEAIVAGTIYDPDDLVEASGPQPSCGPQDPGSFIARLLVNGYLADGVRFLNRIRGRFVFMVHDAAQDRLIAVRDQMGLHPLFHAVSPNGWIFSNSIDALLSNPDVSGALNRVVLAEQLTQRWVDPAETCFTAIRRVPPGHMFELAGGRHALRRYWNPRDRPATSDLDARRQFGDVFDRAVRRCAGPGRAAVFLSGGFDSVSIAATAASAARRDGRDRPYALSLKFEDPACDEELVQRGVAHRLELPHEILTFDQALNHRGLVAPALETTRSWPVPILNVWTPGYETLARRGARQGCDVVLTGTGGDEWLNVTPYLCADLIKRADLVQLARMIAVFRRSFRFTTPQVVRASLWTFGLRPLASQALDTLVPSVWHARRIRKVIGSTPDWIAPDPTLRRELDERAEQTLLSVSADSAGFYDRELQRSLDHPLVCLEHEEHFEFGRRIGASMVHPYLDTDLVELLYGLSPMALTRGGRTKGLVRESVSARFPDLGFETQKKVDATSFFRSHLQSGGATAWRDLGGPGTLADLGILDHRKLVPLSEEVFAGRRPDQHYLIWSALNFETWARPRVLAT
jgi:asparagine synthetase B (glutamine-hydrolysing)